MSWKVKVFYAGGHEKEIVDLYSFRAALKEMEIEYHVHKEKISDVVMTRATPMPQYLEDEIRFLDTMFDTRIKDPRS